MAWELDVYNICTIDECPKEEKHTLNRRQQTCPEQLCSKGSDFFFPWLRGILRVPSSSLVAVMSVDLSQLESHLASRSYVEG